MEAVVRKYFKPERVSEAIKIAGDYADSFRYLAGGTDLLVNKVHGNDSSSCLIDISGIQELSYIEDHEDSMRIGALVKLEDLSRDVTIRGKFPALYYAARAVATPVIRQTATLGGNILCENRCIYYNQSAWWRTAVGLCLKCEGDVCIATQGKKNCFSKFVSDTATVLIALGASVEFADYQGTYTYALEDIYSGDGINPFKVNKRELLKGVIIPKTPQRRCIFTKLRVRESVDFSSLTTAVSVDSVGKIRIVLGALDPKPVLIEGHISDGSEELIRICTKRPRIVDNDVYSRAYRKEMIAVYLKRSFEELGLD